MLVCFCKPQEEEEEEDYTNSSFSIRYKGYISR